MVLALLAGCGSAATDPKADALDWPDGVALPDGADAISSRCTGDEECDDGNPCTTDDRCDKGVCKGTKLLCNEGSECQTGRCNAQGTCDYKLLPGFCFIDGQCWNAKAVAPGPGCQSCNPDWNPSVWAPKQTGSCDDGDACTLDDLCNAGECAGVPKNCPQDADKCTDEVCQEGSCTSVPAKSCNDNNPCTKDSCDPDTGCKHTRIRSPECNIRIELTSPQRGVLRSGDAWFTVKGTVTSPAAKLDTLTINGTKVYWANLDNSEVPFGTVGSFEMDFKSSYGMTLIAVEGVDKLGGKTRVSRSHYYSNAWFPQDAGAAPATVPDSLRVFLGPEVFDDDKTSDVDDLATVITRFVDYFDVGAAIPSPVTAGSTAGCSYEVYATNVYFGYSTVNLWPVDGGLRLSAWLPDLWVDLSVVTPAWACPDFTGTATADGLLVDASLDLYVNSSGKVVANMYGLNIEVVGLDVNLDGVWGFLVNWIIEFFNDDLATMLEDEFEAQLGQMIPGLLQDSLTMLSLNQSFTVPSFAGITAAVPLTIASKPSEIDCQPWGCSVNMDSSVRATKKISGGVDDSLGRDGCGKSEWFSFPGEGSIEVGLHDDLVNEVAFAMYYGGALHMKLTQALLDVDLKSYGIEDLVLNLKPMLPPVISSCNPDSALLLQLGDLGVDAEFKMFGFPMTASLYSSIEIEGSIDSAWDGRSLTVTLGGVRKFEVEFVSLPKAFEGQEEDLVNLIKDQLIGQVLETYAGQILGALPLPSVDLAEFDSSIPWGSAIEVYIDDMQRWFGFTVASGHVAQ